MTDAITLDIQAILKILPHRYPFLLVDRVDALVPNQSIVASKNVTIAEPFFQGHFPGKPIMPGVLIIEAMAQVTAILALYTHHQQTQSEKFLYLLAAINKIRFKSPVVPGDQLKIEATVQSNKLNFYQCNVTASVDTKEVCRAELTGAKTLANYD